MERHAAQALALHERNHNFSHFRSFFPPPIFGGLAHLLL
jgi:hypothetical protein